MLSRPNVPAAKSCFEAILRMLLLGSRCLLQEQLNSASALLNNATVANLDPAKEAGPAYHDSGSGAIALLRRDPN